MSHAGYHTPLDCSCTDCKLRYPKQYHIHTWNDFRKLDSKKMIGDKIYYRDAQEELCKKYNITLLYYRTKWQRRFDGIEHYFNLLRNGLKKFKKALDKQHHTNQKRKKSHKGFSLNDFTLTEKDYSSLTGRTTKQDLDFITGRGKKPDYSFITGKSKKKDYSYITGKNKQKDLSRLYSKKKLKRNSEIDDIVKKLWK